MLDTSVGMRRSENARVLNHQLYDMGMRDNHLFDVAHIEKKIEEVDKEFGLIMIAEKFEESLVLLADLMCWPLTYVTGLKQNARRNNRRVDISRAINKIHVTQLLIYGKTKCISLE